MVPSRDLEPSAHRPASWHAGNKAPTLAAASAQLDATPAVVPIAEAAGELDIVVWLQGLGLGEYEA